MTTPRTTQLAQSSQAIVSAVVAAGVDVVLLMAVICYANYVGSWNLSIIDLISLTMMFLLIKLVVEVIRAVRASEKSQRVQEDRWAVVRGDTLPHAAMPPQQAQNGHRPQPVPVQFKDAAGASWLQ